MAWNPCEDINLNVLYQSEIWTALQTIYKAAYPTVPLPRIHENSVRIKSDYIIERQGVSSQNTDAGYSLLPPIMRDVCLGGFELDMLDWLLNCLSDRMLYLVGPRGAGKSTFLHYIEYALGTAVGKVQVPSLFFIDMCVENECDTEKRVMERIAISIARELQKKASELAGNEHFKSFQSAMLAASNEVSKEKDITKIVEHLKAVNSSSPWQDPRSIVIIFDNLDHLNFNSVNIYRRLIKELLHVAGIGSVLSVRPSLYNRIIESNSARALVPAYIRITPPSLKAWLRHFPDRMVSAYERLSDKREPRKLDGVVLTAKRIYDITSRISELLQKRTQQDNSSRFMEALSSHDMRHFNGLLRRLLQNRTLPKNWLLREVDTDNTPDFYPLFAIMQGARRWFSHNDYVPNLLVSIPKHKSANFLLFHRLLSLLAKKTPPMDLSEVFLTMEEYGADKSETLLALETMRRANVIYGSDLDINWTENQLPDYCGLTEAGVYFLNFLFSDSDYLVSIVLDVPLNHEYLQAHLDEDNFVPQIYSLHEYLIAVKHEENRQLSFMRRRPPSDRLALAVDRLRYGNTYFGKILKGFKDVVLRGVNSTAHSVKSACQNLEPQLKGLEETLGSLEQALDEILNRALKSKTITVPHSVIYSHGEKENIRVSYHQDGSRLNASFKVQTESSADWAILLVWRAADKGGRYPSVNLAKSPSAGAIFKGELNDLVQDETPIMSERASAYIINFEAPKRKYIKFPAILDVAQNKGTIQVTLTINKNEEIERHDLGLGIEQKTLLEWAKPILCTIQERAKKNILEIEIVRGFGIDLGRKVLSSRGISLLENVFLQVGNCWLITDVREIPWEWLCFDAPYEIGSLCDNWNIRRSHMHNNGRHGAIVHTNLDQHVPQTLRTIGLDKGDNQQWRSKVPVSAQEALALIDKAGFVHVVAHAEKPGELKFKGVYDWALTPTDVLGYKPREKERRQEIIISSCKCGAVEDPNIVIEIARHFKCSTWAPLVDIDVGCAKQFDEELEKMCKDGTSTHTIFRELRKTMPFLYLYVCYHCCPV